MRFYRFLFLATLLVLFLASCSKDEQSTPGNTPTNRAANPTGELQPGMTPSPTSVDTISPTETPSESDPTVEPGGTKATPSNTPTEEPAATQEPPSPTPTTGSPSSGATSPTPGDCLEKAAYFGDVTIPDNTFFHQGESFTKTWRFRNEGTCAWTSQYSMVFHSGEIMNAQLSVPFPGSVATGDIVELSVDMEAPTRGGTHLSNWEFEDPNGKRFGTGSSAKDLFWVKIDVRFLDQSGQPQTNPGSAPAPSAPASCNAQRDSGFENQVLVLINQARTVNGLQPLNLSEKLSASAQVHSTDMACKDFVDHSGSNGSSWYDRISAQGYVYTSATENIYVGNPQFGGTPQGAYEWWMNSQIHRDNILEARMSDIGVGYIFNADSEYGGYYTVNFARP